MGILTLTSSKHGERTVLKCQVDAASTEAYRTRKPSSVYSVQQTAQHETKRVNSLVWNITASVTEDTANILQFKPLTKVHCSGHRLQGRPVSLQLFSLSVLWNFLSLSTVATLPVVFLHNILWKVDKIKRIIIVQGPTLHMTHML